MMKDRRTIAAILAAALTLTMCGVSAVADGEADSSAAPDSSVSAQADQADSSAAVGGTPEAAAVLLILIMDPLGNLPIFMSVLKHTELLRRV